MKKVILIGLLILSICLFQEEDYVIPNDSIRFRIIPNSNSSKDIIMKEKATSEVMNVISDFDTSSLNSSREEVYNNLENISNSIEKVFKENNYDETFNINYGLNEFPEKTYKGVKYESGYYESLVVEIGESKGNNYWCVLYPPLCLIDEEKSDKEYKSLVVELINKLF